jgi:hypothetical protein
MIAIIALAALLDRSFYGGRFTHAFSRILSDISTHMGQVGI